MGLQPPQGTELWHNRGPIALCSPGWDLPGLAGLAGEPLLVPDLLLLSPVKPGACPTSPPRGTDLPCRDPCTQDADCPGSAKCCPLACGLACLAPLHGEPGCARGQCRPRPVPSPHRGLLPTWCHGMQALLAGLQLQPRAGIAQTHAQGDTVLGAVGLPGRYP